MPNRLAQQSSPYLLQHQDNPVDWYPWGDEALRRAKEEDKPVFLSVGYSACHWCHVMEHESFEDAEIAAFLNAKFICIKVDREERPDIDQIYMNAVQLMTGHGGWPMSVFLTPDLEPFYGGTYWPPEPRHSMPGFKQVLAGVEDAWRTRRGEAEQQATQIRTHLASITDRFRTEDSGLDESLLKTAVKGLESVFDFTHGGFGSAPKFPHPMDLQVLLRFWHREPVDGVLRMVRLNLDKMAAGGIYDHLGGGFARYAVDQRWLVPHFEKMLYDNGLLATAYLDGYRVTGDANYARVARETLDYVLRDMTDERGGFHSAEDADSEGVEGKFYVWTPEQIQQCLGESDAEKFCYVYDVSSGGNFEDGQSILNLPKTVAQCAAIKQWDQTALESQLADNRARLLEARGNRVRPGKDDKILVSWNALMIDAMAQAGGLLEQGEPYREAARKAARFLLDEVRREDGRLLHTWRQGNASLDAYLDDYAYLTYALVTLYEADFDERWIEQARQLADTMLAHFRDADEGGFFFTADDHETLIVRNKDLHDSSVPSGNSMAATALMRLGTLCENAEYLEAARKTLEMAKGFIEQAPTAAGQMLIAADMHLGPMQQLVVVGDPAEPDTAELLGQIRRRYRPRQVLACRSPGQETNSESPLDPLFEGRLNPPATPALYLCEGSTCQAPAYGLPAALEALAAAG